MSFLDLCVFVCVLFFESFWNSPQLIVLMIWVLAISSLMTVIERKGLASSQRRTGPSYHGWFGLLQIVGDGLKLIYKDYGFVGLFRSSVTSGLNVSIWFPPIWSFVWSYLLFATWYSNYNSLMGIQYWFLLLFLIQGISHLGLVVCGMYTLSKWTILASIRSLVVYLVYDLSLLLTWLILSPHSKMGNNLFESGNVGTLSSYMESQESGMNLFLYPWIVILYYITTLVECGRIPSDLTEAESELVSGYNTEFGGFLYALFASAEYSNMLFHSIAISTLILGSCHLIGLVLQFSLVFFSFLMIRSCLPRFRYVDLLSLSWYYILPFQGLMLVFLLVF